MPNPNGLESGRQRDGWVTIGMLVSATSAALTSFDGLKQLGLAAGWAESMSYLLPLTIDAFAATATRIWLARSTKSERARRFSRGCAIGVIILSLAGNAVFHLIAANLLQVTWVTVLGVGAVPPVVLGLVSHLAVLRTQHDLVVEVETSTVLSPVLPTVVEVPKPEVEQRQPPVSARPGSTPKRKPGTTRTTGIEGLLAAARAADAAYRETHGKGITRDQLRQTLRIGGERATALLRQLKEQAPAG